MAKIIVIEGLDGSGKSTQVKLIKEYLENKGLSVITLHFPINDPEIPDNYSKEIYDILKGKNGPIEDQDPFETAKLFIANRHTYLPKMEKHMQDYDVILLDRYTLSTIAYQQVYAKDKEKFNQFVIDFTKSLMIHKPDLNVYIDLPMETIKERLSKSRTGEDRDYLEDGEVDQFESDLEYLSEVRKNYLDLQQADYNYRIVSGYKYDMIIKETNPYIETEIYSPEKLFNLIKFYIDEII